MKWEKIVEGRLWLVTEVPPCYPRPSKHNFFRTMWPIYPILLDSSRLRLSIQTSEPAHRLQYLSADIICSEKWTVFRGCSSRDCGLRGSDNVQGQISWYVIVWYTLFKTQKHTSTLEPSTALIWIIFYCSPLWDNCGKLLQDKLQRFQASCC